MAKGYDAHQQRQMLLSSFGKDLARRAKSKCELSGASGVALHIYEVPPVPNEPDPDRCLMLCEEVIDQLDKPQTIQADTWHNLRELIWSDIPAVQIMTARILNYLAKEHTWAKDTLDEAYLDEEIVDEANKNLLS